MDQISEGSSVLQEGGITQQLQGASNTHEARNNMIILIQRDRWAIDDGNEENGLERSSEGHLEVQLR